MNCGIQSDTIFSMDTVERTYVDRAARAMREAREKGGLSMREVARLAGTSHATISAYESGRKVPSVATFMRILEACGFALDFVMTPRVRYRDGLAREDELMEVLRLAEQFPARLPRYMDYPKFPSRV